MSTEHRDIPDSQLHESKGVSTASSGSTYVADGSGSGTWEKITHIYTTTIQDVSTASDVYVPVLITGDVVRVSGVLSGAISSSNATVTIYDSSSNSMGTLTVTASGSAAGDSFQVSPTVNNAVFADSYIRVSTDGASTGTVAFALSVEIERAD